MTQAVAVDGAVLHAAFRPGAEGRRPVVFANSLGTDLRIWDAVIDALPADLPVLTWDKRGHGLSDATALEMETHVSDLAALMDRFVLSGAVVCGVSVGGMIAQGLAATRPDLVAGLVLSNTGMKIGDAANWQARIDAVMGQGLESIADAVLERWFARAFREGQPERLELYRNMLIRTPAEGYVATCAAIRDTDYSARAAAISVPCHCLAGDEDFATPPEIVRKLAETVPGAGLTVLPNVGHLPCIEAPEAVARAVVNIHAGLS
ncbi:3-oxoadipate enol-lactonase [Halovulum sp. GXIMD14794]